MTTPQPHSYDKDDLSKSSDVVVGLQDVPMETEPSALLDIDEEYLAKPRWPKFYHSVLWQMLLFGALSFVGPAMGDAITNLGGGGLKSPWLANLANSLNYVGATVMTLFGGPIINKIGIKWSCVVAAAFMPLAGSGYYVSARFPGPSGDAYLLAARVIGGFTNGFLYVAETTAMLSYPHINERGKYLGIWSAMRNSGSVMGGAINFANNYSLANAGGIVWSTYLIFVGFECTGFIWAFLLSQTKRVRRADGTRVPCSLDISWVKEFKALGKHVMSRRVWLMAPPALYSFFYGGVCGTYLSRNFSVRSRALSSLVTPAVTIVMVVGYGFILDRSQWSQKKRAWIAFLLWLVPQTAGFVWLVINDNGFFKNGHPALDYGLDGGAWAKAWFPYLIVFTTGYWCQLSIYWILGTFSTDVKSASRTGGLFRSFETIGQAISYGINSKVSKSDVNIPLYINIGLLAIVVPCMIGLIRLVPVKPEDHDDVADGVVATQYVMDQDKA